MNVGQMKERITILELQQKEAAYNWEPVTKVWAEAEKQSKTNIFSKIGVGVQTVVFRMRRRELNLHNAIRWRGRHCFLTDILEVDRMYLEVTAALIEPVGCREISEEGDGVLFPACLTEKYLRYREEAPRVIETVALVMVTPKAITLRTGAAVMAAGVEYHLTARHELGEYQNEYEIERQGEL